MEKTLCNLIIDGNIDSFEKHIKQYGKIPQICLYYAFGVKNIDICNLCLENGCKLDDITLKIALLFHDPQLLVLFIKSRYQINNEYVKYLFKYDKFSGAGGTCGQFNDKNMYELNSFISDENICIDDNDEYINPITYERIKYRPSGVYPCYSGFLQLLAKNYDLYIRPDDSYFSKFMNFTWYTQEYGVPFMCAGYIKRNHKYEKEIENINECIELLKKYNKLIVTSEIKKQIVVNQIFEHKYLENIDDYDISYVIDILCDLICKKDKVLKKDITFLKKIFKKKHIKDTTKLNISDDKKTFLDEHVFC